MTKLRIETSPVEHGQVARWIEADIVEVDVQETPEVFRRLTCRVFGMNAPEPYGITEETARRARQRADELTRGTTIRCVFLHLPASFLIPPRFKAYGRTVVRIFLPDGREVADLLVGEGLAVPYFMGIGQQEKPAMSSRGY